MIVVVVVVEDVVVIVVVILVVEAVVVVVMVVIILLVVEVVVVAVLVEVVVVIIVILVVVAIVITVVVSSSSRTNSSRNSISSSRGSSSSSMVFRAGVSLNIHSFIHSSSMMMPMMIMEFGIDQPIMNIYTMLSKQNTIHIVSLHITDLFLFVFTVPTIQFAESAYSVNEPSEVEQMTTVTLRVVRTGDLNTTSSVRCSTRDGSAQSGSDYNPKSLVLKFPPGNLP